jgi:hypothetical protein
MGVEWDWLQRVQQAAPLRRGAGARQRIVLELDGALRRCIIPVTRFLAAGQPNASTAGRLSIKG